VKEILKEFVARSTISLKCSGQALLIINNYGSSLSLTMSRYDDMNQETLNNNT
jgi:hypothetical protein